MKKLNLCSLLLSVFLSVTAAHAQSTLIQDYSSVMSIPNVVAMEASSAHLYVLSKSEGLAVFRSYPDSLQWLYTSEGMQQRGSFIEADIRFAYLYGNSRRLTVLEPTSILGIYSSTILPEKPRSVARIDNQLFIALGDSGVGYLSLKSPEAVDSALQYIDSPEHNGKVLDVISHIAGGQLFVLTDAPSLLIFETDNEKPILSSDIFLNRELEKLFIDEDKLWGADAAGNIYELGTSGIGKRLGSIGESVSELLFWREMLFIRGESGVIYTTTGNGRLEIWKDDETAGNFVTESQDKLWLSENDNITAILIDDESRLSRLQSDFKIEEIQDVVLSYPEPLLLPLNIEGDAAQAEFSYTSTVNNAQIRKNGFYWQPTVNQIGIHRFKIKAVSAEGRSDSITFTVDVRSFNAPPQFNPVRPVSIAVNEKFNVQYRAVDPENPESDLIRYIGVDLPQGAKLDEKTGEFSWTPSNRQVGESTFRIIATDKSGAASSMDVTLRVLDISRGN